ncbi:MAG TPA: 4'-phosphopantetheinyl transferase superfamily protein [Cellulomonas sp.]
MLPAVDVRPAALVRWARVLPPDELGAALVAAERERTDRAPAREHDALAGARRLARLVAAEACALPVDEVRVDRRCPRCGSTVHGVPRVRRADGGPVPHLSLSRAPDLVVVAVAPVGPVGVDVERTDADPRASTTAVALAPGEPVAAGPDGWLRTWVRKEAVLKAAGTGLAVDPRSFRVSDDAGRPVVTGDVPPPPAGSGWWLADLDLGRDHRAALALARPAAGVDPATPPRVEVAEVVLSA